MACRIDERARCEHILEGVSLSVSIYSSHHITTFNQWVPVLHEAVLAVPIFCTLLQANPSGVAGSAKSQMKAPVWTPAQMSTNFGSTMFISRWAVQCSGRLTAGSLIYTCTYIDP